MQHPVIFTKTGSVAICLEGPSESTPMKRDPKFGIDTKWVIQLSRLPGHIIEPHRLFTDTFRALAVFVPPVRKRPDRSLSLAEREEISRGIVAGLPVRTIAKDLGRAPSTISREINRNGGADEYRATLADKNAWARALRPKACRLVFKPAALSAS